MPGSRNKRPRKPQERLQLAHQWLRGLDTPKPLCFLPRRKGKTCFICSLSAGASLNQLGQQASHPTVLPRRWKQTHPLAMLGSVARTGCQAFKDLAPLPNPEVRMNATCLIILAINHSDRNMSIFSIWNSNRIPGPAPAEAPLPAASPVQQLGTSSGSHSPVLPGDACFCLHCLP